MGTIMTSRNIKIFFAPLLTIFLLIYVYPVTAQHRPVLEPHQLAGTRIVFTNWYFVRPPHIDWVDDQGQSVYRSDNAEFDGYEANFVSLDAPHGIRLFVEPAQREIPIIPNDKPWDKWAIRLYTLIHENGKYRFWGRCYSDNLQFNNSDPGFRCRETDA